MATILAGAVLFIPVLLAFTINLSGIGMLVMILVSVLLFTSAMSMVTHMGPTEIFIGTAAQVPKSNFL
jgi:multidrug transporter EmrE-like cation transporter